MLIDEKEVVGGKVGERSSTSASAAKRMVSPFEAEEEEESFEMENRSVRNRETLVSRVIEEGNGVGKMERESR